MQKDRRQAADRVNAKGDLTMNLNRDYINRKNKKVSPARKIAISAMSISLYILIMFLTQNFAFGQFQIRVATSLYALSAVYPFLIVPLGLANFLSNTLLGGLGPLDMIGGMAAGIITTSIVYIENRWNLNDWLMVVPIVLVPGLMVPIWLTYIIHVPYIALVLSVSVGQIIPGILGVLLVKQLRKVVRY